MISKKDHQTTISDIKEGQWKNKPIRYRVGRLIVKFKKIPAGSDMSATLLTDSLLADLPDGSLARPIRSTGRAIFNLKPDTSISQIAKQISKRDDVEYAEPDVIDSAAVMPSDTRYGQQWGHAKVNSPTAWDLETGSTSILIGIIDSGISMQAVGGLDHPDLNDSSRYILGTDFVDGGTPRDLNGHGTHVTGISAAESNNSQGVVGMNWHSPVYICRTLDASGNGGSADFADAVEEITDYAIAHNMKAVINYSAGGGANQTKRDACQYAHDHGMIICAATGNDNHGSVIYPAAYSTQFDAVIAVGSTDSDDTVSSFSNVGPEVTVVAPGRNIMSTMPTYSVGIPANLNYDYLDGTSMATPLVTGLVALMWSRHPGFSNTKIRECLISTAVKLGAVTFHNDWGYGRVDAEAAVKCGDLIFPFTVFTRFTFYTTFTPFTYFTRFTPFTPITRFTPFTPFTRITRFTPFTRFPDPHDILDIPGPKPFVRFGNSIIDTQDLEITRFEELATVHETLKNAGITHIDQIATSDTNSLAEAINFEPAEVVKLIELAQALLRGLR